MRRPSATSAPAFTLIELLIVIILIATLISMISVELTSMRRLSLRTKTLSSISSCSAIFHMYATDWRDSWPAFATPGPDPTTLPLGNHDTVNIPFYFMSSIMWRYALAYGYFEGNYSHPSMFPAEQTAYFGGPGGTPFIYPCTFLAAPAYWRSESRLDSRQWRRTFRYEVLYPSNKSLLVSGLSSIHPQVLGLSDQSSPKNLIPIASVDGSAKARVGKSVRRGYSDGDGTEQGFYHTVDSIPGVHTLGGLRGRDY